MKMSALCWSTLLLSTLLFIIGLKLFVGARHLTSLETLEALTLLTMLPVLQARAMQIQRRDIRDETGAKREDWKQQFLLIVLGFELMLSFGLWLATDLLRV